MNVLFYSLSITTIITSLFCAITWILRIKKDNLVFNKQYFWIVNIMSIFSSVLLFIFCYKNQEFETLIIFAMMAILGLIANMIWYNEIIFFEGEQFTVRNFLGYKKSYNYNAVIGFRIKREKYKYANETTAYFYVDNKKFSILT